MLKEIRPVEPDEVEALAALSCETFIDAFKAASNPENFEIYVRDNLNETVLGMEMTLPRTQYWFGIDENEEIVGYLKLRWDRSTDFFEDGKALELQRIYLKKSAWNKGYGVALLHFAEKMGKHLGLDWIYLIVWCENQGTCVFTSARAMNSLPEKTSNSATKFTTILPTEKC